MSIKPGSRRRNYADNPDNPKKVGSPKFTDPHTPWQIMIEKARSDMGLSIRALGEKSKISSGTLFNWLRSLKGYPSKQYYTHSVNKRLAVALSINPERLLEAYNQSAAIQVSQETSEHQPRTPRPGIKRTLPVFPG